MHFKQLSDHWSGGARAGLARWVLHAHTPVHPQLARSLVELTTLRVSVLATRLTCASSANMSDVLSPDVDSQTTHPDASHSGLSEDLAALSSRDKQLLATRDSHSSQSEGRRSCMAPNAAVPANSYGLRSGLTRDPNTHNLYILLLLVDLSSGGEARGHEDKSSRQVGPVWASFGPPSFQSSPAHSPDANELLARRPSWPRRIPYARSILGRPRWSCL